MKKILLRAAALLLALVLAGCGTASPAETVPYGGRQNGRQLPRCSMRFCRLLCRSPTGMERGDLNGILRHPGLSERRESLSDTSLGVGSVADADFCQPLLSQIRRNGLLPDRLGLRHRGRSPGASRRLPCPECEGDSRSCHQPYCPEPRMVSVLLPVPRRRQSRRSLLRLLQLVHRRDASGRNHLRKDSRNGGRILRVQLLPGHAGAEL